MSSFIVVRPSREAENLAATGSQEEFREALREEDLRTEKQASGRKEKHSWGALLSAAIAFCEERGWRVESSTVDSAQYFSSPPVIKINRKKSSKTCYYVLLHEIGHMLVCSKPNYKKMFGAEHKTSYSSLTYKIRVLEEEFAAWAEGEKLAKKNKWTIDKDFHKIKAQRISSYCIWANHRKHPHPAFTRNSRNKKNDKSETTTSINDSSAGGSAATTASSRNEHGS